VGAFLGALAALGIALTDIPGRRLNVRAGPITTSATIQFWGGVCALLGLLFVGSTFRGDELVLGLLSGIGMAVGLGGYYAGLLRASSAVVAPIVAVLNAVLPYIYALIRGSSPSAVAVGGAAVSFVGLAIVTASGSLEGDIRAGVRWALISGVGYGVAISVLVDVGDGAGAWPGASQRLSAFIVIAALALHRRARPLPERRETHLGVFAGVFAGATSVLYLLALEADPSSAVVTASLFPIGSVAVGRFTQGDLVTRAQVIGIGVVLFGVIGVIAG